MTKALMLIAVLVAATPAHAQTARPPGARETDAIAALTAELRALRAELAETARTSLRLQLLTARIQAQEQRIIYLDRQRTEASTRRITHEQGIQAVRNQLSMFATTELAKVPAEERQGIGAMVTQLKRDIENQERLLADLRTQEVDAENALSQEQARWSDLNNRLEELERSLK